ncbi:MAG TPA: PilZ domain-containing protein [Terriglobales bacterium]|jgi:c-di-GMP-binding flagellar brake protein YcgR|nr:PilZ domain-containing protein [Terriglobales bacterium]
MSSSSTNAGMGVRRSQRFRVNFPIKLFAVVQQRRCILQGRSHDLSDAGMAIYIPAELQVGQMVQIEFILPDSNQRLGVTALVRDCSGFRCGVEFLSLTPTEQKALTDCCDKLSAASA